jgi:hypothetical protein
VLAPLEEGVGAQPVAEVVVLSRLARFGLPAGDGVAVEASPERVRDHLRRPLPGTRNLLAKNAGNTINEIGPAPAVSGPGYTLFCDEPE